MPGISYKASLIFKALGLSPKANASDRGPVAFSEICTDSRKVTPGCLFVPLKGDRFDGHEFIPQAVAAGATGIVCEKSSSAAGGADRWSGPAGQPTIFRVEDALKAYRAIARAWRETFRIPLVAVAGSVGKTTSKELLAAILSGKWDSVLKTRASENGFVGIPMTLLELRPEHDAAVIEIGIDDIGAMTEHLELVEPQAALLTAIAPEHLEKLIDLDTVAREELLALTHTAEKGGFVAVNEDDERIRAGFAAWLKGRRRFQSFVRFELKPTAAGSLPAPSKADPRLVARVLPGELEVSGCDLNQAKFPLPLPGAHNARNLLGAIALAKGLGLSESEIRKGLKRFQGVYGRSELKTLPNGAAVYCDYYNASPASVEASLSVLVEQTARSKGRRWVCLGDMLELGPQELEFHRGLAPKMLDALDRPTDSVLLFGTRMKSLAAALDEAGFGGKLRHFTDRAELAKTLLASIKETDFVLIKGSRSMKMEEVHQALEAELQEE